MVTVYALSDPRDNTIRYIGISDDVYRRFAQHITVQGNNIKKDTWIQELKDNRLMPVLSILETVDTQELARERETSWIRRYLDEGMPLTNNLEMLYAPVSMIKPAHQDGQYKVIKTEDEWYQVVYVLDREKREFREVDGGQLYKYRQAAYRRCKRLNDATPEL